MYDFLKFNFSYFTTQVKLFLAQKRIPKTLGFKNVMKRGIKKNSHFRENNTEAPVISKRRKFP